MKLQLICVLYSLGVTGVVVYLTQMLNFKTSTSPMGRYMDFWKKNGQILRVQQQVKFVPFIQIGAIVFFGAVSLMLESLLCCGGACLAIFIPPLFLKRMVKKRRQILATQLDSTLTALSNALIATPNLTDAFASLLDSVSSPMKDEIEDMLAKVRLGNPLSKSLLETAERLNMVGFNAAATAVTIGQRTGGNMRKILIRTAATVREMDRLEGVLKTKTAEGRGQALVMGIIPPLLMVLLHFIDPNWLLPLWQDPIGWMLLGVAAILEVAAVVIIQKIMAVDL